ncbi:LacI family DNA-binding transcriptional regulator [Pseudonocardia sp. HH130630-07]|uniref:LacI family DNA-binding transcriptional regulator n=1 Tax=Pseudonocardia sp. HH130630-07 TaxID=1690815 RepID=UPI000814FD8B|nr:LacI family DNA-binding transcriptional regulator [Pseudonocardia sp. HH130630-07]ANY07087.1 LacI family transcriptional regulator [Pseudonocardia sp. HH130630-07]
MTGPLHQRRPATLASLAAELGVSRTTVSNAYNRPDQLSAPLRERVLEAARRLGYPGPDPVARSLRTRRAGAVGLLLTEALSYAFRDPGATGFLEGLALACEKAGTGLLLIPVSPENSDVDAVYQAGVDGFVVYSVSEDDPHFKAVLQRPVPTVVCDQPADVEGVDRVCVDDRAGTLALGRHLVELGHRRVGVLCMRLGTRHDGPADPARQEASSYSVQRERLAGLREAFAEAGVDWADVPVIERYEHTLEAGADGARALLDAHPRTTAVVCTSDILALGALDAARGRGLRVPEDLSVAGFDGVPDAARAGLTTVRQPFRAKGLEAGRLLLERGERNSPERVVLPTELVVGHTTRALRQSGEFFSGW